MEETKITPPVVIGITLIEGHAVALSHNDDFLEVMVACFTKGFMSEVRRNRERAAFSVDHAYKIEISLTDLGKVTHQAGGDSVGRLP